MSRSMTLVPLIAIFTCIIFFVIAFSITRPGRSFDVPVVNVTVASGEAASSLTNHIMYSESYQEKLKTILQDRESIVIAEHDRFRAELGTWLSIFGLLAILATIMVAAFSFACQQSSLKEEKDEINKKFEDMKSELCSFGNRINESITDNATSVGFAGGVEVQDAANNSTGNSELEEVQAECVRFIKMWPGVRDSVITPEEMFSEKIDAGVCVLKRYNQMLSLCSGSEAETILKKMHVISNYLGKVKNGDFYRLFVDALKQNRPLTMSCEKIAAKISDSSEKSMLVGYYRHLYNLQS